MTTQNQIKRQLVTIIKTKVLTENTNDMMFYVQNKAGEIFWVTSFNFITNYKTN